MHTFVIATCCLLAPAAAPPPKPHITIRVVGRGDKTPDLAWLIVVSPRGDLRNIMSHPLDDRVLERVLRKNRNGKKVLVKVVAAVEAETTIETLIGAVERIKRCAAPDSEITIYLYFCRLSGFRRLVE